MELFRYFWKYARGFAVASVVVGLINGVSTAAILAWLNLGLSQAQHPNVKTGLQYAALVFIAVVSNFAAQAISMWLAETSGQRLRVELARAIAGSPLRRLEEIGGSRLFVQITQEANYICDAFIKIPEFLINAIALLASLIYLGSLSLTLLLVLVMLLVGCVFNFLAVQRMAMRYTRVARAKWDELAAHFQALIDGVKELKLNDQLRQFFFSDKIEGASLQFRALAYQAGLRYGLLTSINSIFYYVVTGVIVFGLPFWSDFTVGALTSYALVILFLRGPVSSLVQIFPTFDRARIALERTRDLKLTLVDDEGRAGWFAHDLPKVVQHSIEMLGVKHSYYSVDDERHFVLGPVDFSVIPGKIVFVVGGNGSGKTTFAKLLTGLYRPESGRVKVDGRPVEDWNRQHYRQYFSSVFQDFYLFQHLLGPDDSKDQSVISVFLSRLRLDQKVSVRNGSLSTIDLSRGQRKRLALLAALVEDKQVYVFDEWAADQDPEFKRVFYLEILSDLKARGKAVVVISHDDRYYHIADEIVRLEEGQLTIMDYPLHSFEAGGSG